MLNIGKEGTGVGLVISSPTGINCGSTCSASFDEGKTITLTATPAEGSVFTGWSGSGCAGANTCQVTLGADTKVTATFTKNGKESPPEERPIQPPADGVSTPPSSGGAHADTESSTAKKKAQARKRALAKCKKLKGKAKKRCVKKAM